LSRESAKERKPEMAQSGRKVLVEKVAQELAYSVIGPATVYEQ